MSLTGLRSRTSNVELLIRSHQTSVAKFLSRSQDAHIAIIGNSSNANSNIGYIGNDSRTDELYFSQELDQKAIGFSFSNIKLYTDPIYHTDVLASGSNYDINTWESAYLKSNQLTLNNALFDYNISNLSLINKQNNSFLEINAKQLRIQDESTGYYSILSTGAETGAKLSTYSSNGTLINSIDIGLADTSIFPEATNRYFTVQRVKDAVGGSDIDMTDTSNALLNDLLATSNEVVLSLSTAKTYLNNYLISNSNVLSQQLYSMKTELDTNLAQYLTTTSNNTLQNLSATSNQFVTFMQTTDMYTNMLQYIDNNSNQLYSSIVNNSNNVNSNLQKVYNTLQMLVNDGSNNLLSLLVHTSNAKINDINIKLADIFAYTISTSNSVMINALQVTQIFTSDSDADTSNYMSTTSNVLLKKLEQTSNTINADGLYTYITNTSNYSSIAINDTIDTLSQKISSLVTDSDLPALSESSNRYIVNDEYAGNLFTCNMTIIGDIIPHSNLAFDLGTPEMKWKDVYVTGNSIYLSDTVIGMDTEAGGFSVKSSDNQLTQLVTTSIKILDDSGNYTALQSENNEIVLTAYTPSGEIDTNVSQEKTTNDIPELPGASNLYYTAERAGLIINESNIMAYGYTADVKTSLNNRITGLSADHLQSGVQYEFITSNTYAKNLLVNARISASNLNVIGASTIIKTFKYETENVVSDSIKVTQKGSQNVAELNVVLKNDGKIGIGSTVPVEKLDVSSNIRFTSSINTLTSNEFGYVNGLRSTLNTQLVTLKSNISSNYATTSNNIHSNLLSTVSAINTRISTSDSNVSNYLFNTSNYYENILKQTSNNLPSSVQALNNNVSNYIRITSNTLASNLTLTSNNISTRITTLGRDMSNYLDITSNAYSSNLLITSNTLSSIVNNVITTGWTASNSVLIFNNNIGINNNAPTEKLDISGSIRFTGSINATTSNQINYLKNVTTSVQTQINNLNTFGSNYISSSSNAINSNLVLNSNLSALRLRNLDTNMSNYVQVSSNNLRISLTNTSNQIDTRIKSASSTLWSNMTTVTSNIFITSNVIIGSNVATSVTSNRLTVFKGDINIRNGNVKRQIIGTGSSGGSGGTGPAIWYQFEQDPTITNTLNDSNVLGTKYDLSINEGFFIDTTNLQAWYQFDSNLNDMSGKNYNASQGSTTLATFDASAKVRGTASIKIVPNSYLTLTSGTATNVWSPAASFSIAFWCRLTQTHTSFQVLAACRSGVSNGWNFVINTNSTNIYFETFKSTGKATTNVLLGTNVWKHIVATISYNSSSSVTVVLYIDGAQNQTYSGDHYTPVSLSTLTIGKESEGTSYPVQNANIDDFRFYNKVLTAAEVAVLYNYSPILTKTTGYTTNSYLYQNAYLWNGSPTVAADNVFLQYSGSATNIQTLLNTFHTNGGFSIHFVFRSTNTSSTSQILFIGNTATGPTDRIRIYLSNDAKLNFKVGGIVLSSAAYTANVYYIVDLVCTISGANMVLLMSVYNPSSSQYLNNNTQSASVAHSGILSTISSTSDLVYWIGKYTDTNDATPVTLQDLRIFPYAMTTAQVTAIQSGSTAYVASSGTITITSNYQLHRWNNSPNYYTGTPKFITYSEGNIGIRTTNPLAKMHVGAGTASVTSNMVYFSSSIRPTSNNYNLQNICGTFDSSILVTGTIASSSDQRIKTHIDDINDNSALQKLLTIQPKTYNYIDANRGSENIYGFIAQQIGEVIPEAVSTQTDTVPNVYAYADCTGSTITFADDVSVASNEYLKTYANLDIINYDTINQIEKRDTYTIIAKDIIANSITINKPINSDKVFVYGTKVEDFHTLNKSYIYTLNVCATQTLADKVIQLKSKLSSLEKSS